MKFILCLLSILVFSGTIFLEETDLSYFEKPQRFSMVFTGDVMLDRGVELKTKRVNNWCFPMERAKDFLSEADISVINLEGPLSDKGSKVGSIYSFRMDPLSLEALTCSGVDVISFANNHVFDYGRLAFEDTLERMKDAGILVNGAGLNEDEAYAPAIKEISGTKVGFLSFTNLGSLFWEAQGNESGISWLNEEKVCQAIRNAQTDLTIVSFHFGDEYKEESNSFQKRTSRLAIDCGADLVIGHHPHVSEEIEMYKGKIIAYSLGNFVFDQDFSESTMRGLVLKAMVVNGVLKKIYVFPVKINQDFQPEILKNEAIEYQY